MDSEKDLQYYVDKICANFSPPYSMEEMRSRFREAHGEILEGNSINEKSFLRKVLVVDNSRMYVKKNYSAYVSNFSAFCFGNRVQGPIPYDFFSYGIMVKMLSMMPVSPESISQEEIVDYEEEKSEDFLGLFGLTEVDWVPGYDYSGYYDRVRKLDIRVVVKKYRNWLKFHSLPTKVSEVGYSDPREFVNTSEKQFPVYYESVYKLKSQLAGRTLFIPNDGLGLMSMVCIMLGVVYESTEPFGIGDIARGLGIISSNSLRYKPERGEVLVMCNLDAMLEYSNFTSGDYLIVEENRLYTGIELSALKLSTHGRVSTNVIKEDDFITSSRPIAHSAPMLRNKDVVPTSAKAEMFLIQNNMKVYTDGAVVTFTQSEVTKSPFYICSSDTGSFVKIDTFTLINGTSPFLGTDFKSEIYTVIGKNITNVLLRQYMRKKAKELFIDLQVCNRGDDVIFSVQGEETAVKDFFRWLTDEGSPGASVLQVEKGLVREMFQTVPIEKQVDALNILNRNRPLNERGKIGNKKYYNGVSYMFDDVWSKVYSPSGFEIKDNKMYDNPQELRNWTFANGFYMACVANPNRVKYLYDGEDKIYLIFLHRYDGGSGRIVSVFKDIRLSQLISYKV